jgi:hypothetical protein
VQRVWDEITHTGRVQPALYNTILDTELVPGAQQGWEEATRAEAQKVKDLFAKTGLTSRTALAARDSLIKPFERHVEEIEAVYAEVAG